CFLRMLALYFRSLKIMVDSSVLRVLYNVMQGHFQRGCVLFLFSGLIEAIYTAICTIERFSFCTFGYMVFLRLNREKTVCSLTREERRKRNVGGIVLI
ncbi:hypothetical protein, partial [Bartonella rochalimae]|uniref:hypothetical protein n=1 Tax=Bartonella rochalimae TaxID=395923 RepID=UPI001AEBF592